MSDRKAAVAYAVAANSGTTQRVGTLTIVGLTYTVIQAGTGPAISLVANAEGESPTIAPNTWVEIKGVNLAPAGDTRIWQGYDFVSNQMPTQLDGVSATVNGKAAYVYYISPAQVNILTPPDAMQGSVQVQVTSNSTTSAPMTVQVQSLSPSFFVFNAGRMSPRSTPTVAFSGRPVCTQKARAMLRLDLNSGSHLLDYYLHAHAHQDAGRHPLPLRIAAINGLRRPCITAITHSGLSSAA